MAFDRLGDFMVNHAAGGPPGAPWLVGELAALVPGWRLVTVAGAAYHPCVEQPAAVAEAMLGLFEETDLG